MVAAARRDKYRWLRSYPLWAGLAVAFLIGHGYLLVAVLAQAFTRTPGEWPIWPLIPVSAVALGIAVLVWCLFRSARSRFDPNRSEPKSERPRYGRKRARVIETGSEPESERPRRRPVTDEADRRKD
jgi:hypothetical protein